MTAKATKTRPTRNSGAQSASSPEAEFRRYSPEEVYDLKLLPYNARTIREKCYRRELWFHNDGGRITFTVEDLRRNADLGAQAPAA